MKFFWIGYGLLLAVTSVVTWAAYGIDKRRAKRDGRRISERTLQMLAFAGGWPGALAGQQMFRHKTQKTSFRIVFALVVAAHLLIVGGIVYLIWRNGR